MGKHGDALKGRRDIEKRTGMQKSTGRTEKMQQNASPQGHSIHFIIFHSHSHSFL